MDAWLARLTALVSFRSRGVPPEPAGAGASAGLPAAQGHVLTEQRRAGGTAAEPCEQTLMLRWAGSSAPSRASLPHVTFVV